MVSAGEAVPTYIVLALLGPSVCALLLRGVTDGPRAARDLLRGLVRWRAPWWAWTFALLGNGIVVTAVAVIAVHLLGDGDVSWRPVAMGVTVVHSVSGGSLLLAAVLHGGENAWTGQLFVQLFGAGHDLAFAARQLAAVVVALVLLVATRGTVSTLHKKA